MNDAFSKVRSLTSSLTVRLFLIGFLILILLVPLAMIGFLVYERQDRQSEAKREIASKWGESQTLIGPFIKIPYGENTVDSSKFLNIFPETLSITSTVTPETRSRGIFDVLLYTTDVKMTGSFASIESLYSQILEKNIQADKAVIAFSVSDSKGLQKEVIFTFNTNHLNLEPIPTSRGYAPLLETSPFGINRNQSHTFELNVSIKGSEELRFMPLGKNTTLAMSSPWAFPSFNGAFLPTEHQIRNDGFTAIWQISPFSKTLPTYVIEPSNEENFFYKQPFNDSSFGIDFFFPTDFYQKTTRSVKYGILFIIFTFITFFLFEVLHRLKVHPFQYLLVGISLSIFYLLLLSFSEQIGFFPAYIIASLATIALNTSYAIKIFHSKKKGLIVGGVLAALYAYLYFIINNTDYALLIGSVSLFGIVALVMYLTRNINWYQMQEQER